jgi:hypothetical protein
MGARFFSNCHHPETQVQDSLVQGWLGRGAERARRCIGWPLLVTLSRSEGSHSLGREMLRGVYTERSECVQHDSAVLLPRHRQRRAFL